jgi:copper homeostasis protein
MGVTGLVFGGITEGKDIDMKMIEAVMKEVNTAKVSVTFHKAFDQVNNVLESYDKLSSLGIDRVLTQGGQQPIVKNFETLRQIIDKSKKTHKTKVLLGGGVTFANVK